MTELLTVSSVLTDNNMVHSEKGRRICRSVPGTAPRSAGVTSTVCEGVMEKWLTLWICEMTTHSKTSCYKAENPNSDPSQ